jgi:hypothetical protein
LLSSFVVGVGNGMLLFVFTLFKVMFKACDDVHNHQQD